MNYKILLVSLLALSQVTSGSDLQPYAGLQFRFEESFVDLFTKEFFYVLPTIVDAITAKIPQQYQFLNIYFTEIGFSNMTIDPARANFTIDKARNGIKMNWAELVEWDFHCHIKIKFILFLSWSWTLDVKMRDVILDNGLSLAANDHTGAPVVNFFDTQILLGKSEIDFSGNFAMWIIGWFANFLKLPLQVLMNMFLQPAINFAINWIIIPKVLDNGFIEVNTLLPSSPQASDILVLDITLPQQPQFHDESMDTFTDAAFYFKSEGKKYQPPTTPMRFQLDDYNFQFAISSFSVNQFLYTLFETKFIVLPIYYNLLESVIGVDLSTTLFLVIIPELFYNYGSKKMNMIFTPLPGFELDWSQQTATTDADIKVQADFQIVEADNSTVLAFSSIMDISADVALQIVGENKTVNLTLSNLKVTGFNVTVDNCYVKGDESGIMSRLNTVMAAVEASVNALVSKLAPTLPQFNTIDYKVAFDYQQSAFGTGLLITPKSDL